MHRAAGLVAFETRERETFRHNALARKSRIAVQQNWHDGGAVLVVQLVLLGADLAQNHGVHRFEVAGVRGQRQVNRIAVKLTVRRGAEVVFHIARTIHVVRFEAAALEFVKDCAVGFLHHIGEHRQAAPVGHADNDVLDAQLAAAFNDLLHRRDKAFAAIKTKAFGAHVFDVQELFETFGFDQLGKDRLAAFFGEVDFLAVAFDPFLQPTGLLRVGDMHVLQREGTAVGGAHDVDDLLHGRDFKAQHLIDEDRAVHVGIGKTVGLRIKLWLVASVAHAQRVEIGGQVAPDAVGADQHQRADAVEHGLFDLCVGNLNPLLGGFGLDLVARGLCFGRFGPDARQCAHHLASRRWRPIAARPRGASGLGLRGFGVIAHRCKKRLPCFVDRIGVIGIAGVHRLKIFRVFAFHEGRGVELFVGGLVGHWVTFVRRGRRDGVRIRVGL